MIKNMDDAPLSDSERITESAESVESKVYASKRLAPFFEIEVTLKIFGHVIWNWVFPPIHNSKSTNMIKNMDDAPLSDSERITESAESVESKVYASKRLAPFFEIEVTLKIFGHVIWNWVFPPKKSSL